MSSFYRNIFFSSVIPSFSFFTLTKGLWIRLRPSDILVFKNFANLTGIHLCWNEACIFFKKRLQHGCFPVKFAKFLGTSFFTGHFWWLILFTLRYLHLLAFTYLHLLIYTYVLFTHYMNLIKLIKYGKYRICDEIF